MNLGVWLAATVPDRSGPPPITESMRSAGHARFVDLAFVGAVAIVLAAAGAIRYLYVVRHQAPDPPSAST